jgi:hypothetical protein
LVTLFTFFADGPEEGPGAATTEVRRKVVVKRRWSFMAIGTRLRSSNVFYGYRHINGSRAAINQRLTFEFV